MTTTQLHPVPVFDPEAVARIRERYSEPPPLVESDTVAVYIVHDGGTSVAAGATPEAAQRGVVERWIEGYSGYVEDTGMLVRRGEGADRAADLEAYLAEVAGADRPMHALVRVIFPNTASGDALLRDMLQGDAEDVDDLFGAAPERADVEAAREAWRRRCDEEWAARKARAADVPASEPPPEDPEKDAYIAAFVAVVSALRRCDWPTEDLAALAHLVKHTNARVLREVAVAAGWKPEPPRLVDTGGRP